MLEVDTKFAEDVAVPAVSSLRELGLVLQDCKKDFGSVDINQVLGGIQQRTGTQNVGIGIKTVLECVYKARRSPQDLTETFIDDISQRISRLLI